MLTLTTDTVPGQEIVTAVGIVQGSTVRTRHMGSDFVASLKSMVGGELSGYTKLVADARAEALDRMSTEAQRLGADAVVGVRFSIGSGITDGIEVLAYGTAVRLKR